MKPQLVKLERLLDINVVEELSREQLDTLEDEVIYIGRVKYQNVWYLVFSNNDKLYRTTLS